MIIGLSYTMFVIVRCIQKNLDPSVVMGMKMYLRGCAVYYSFPTTYHLFMLLKKKELLRLSGHILSFMDIVDAVRVVPRVRAYVQYMFHSQSFSILFVLLDSALTRWVVLSEAR